MNKDATIFSVQPDVLGRLDPSEGVRLLRDLLWCEASRLAVPRNNIVISLNNTVKDFGIDARVLDAPVSDSLLVRGDTFFQLKTGKVFKPWNRSSLHRELFGKGDVTPAKSHLGEAIRQCLDARGRYAIVTLGHDLQPFEHAQAISNLYSLLEACGYKNPSIEILGQGQVIGILHRFPSLCLDVNNRSGVGFQSFASWSQNSDMRFDLKLGEAQQAFVKKIREYLRGKTYKHVRIIGEPGIGKTQMALEILSAEDLRAMTVYVPNGEDFQQSQLFNELLRPDRDFAVLLVVDDCDSRDRTSIWRALKNRQQLKLITIDHGPEESVDSLMKVCQVPPLSDSQVAEIIGIYIGEHLSLPNWARWCDGSPRVAHAVGANLLNNPDDILKQPADVDIWNRFILGHKRRDSREAEQHLIVLRYAALFSRFGFESPVEAEAEFISHLVSTADPSLTWARFQAIVIHYKKQRILQGRHTLFIVPKALHVYLWRDWWDEYGRGFNFAAFFDAIPDSLRSWFLELFIYAHSSTVATRVVSSILSPSEGPFANKAFLISDGGARFLSTLAETDPNATLELIEFTFGTWTIDELRGWHTGRQNIVWALEKIAVWEDTCLRVVAVLARMALAENARNSNNSTGVLYSLFNIVAPTQASGELRLQMLATYLRSEHRDLRRLGVALCGQWLSTHGYVRIVGAEYQGMRPTIKFWLPRTYDDLWDYLIRGWRVLWDETRGWPDEDRAHANVQLIASASGLLRIGKLSSLVLNDMFELSRDEATDLKQLTQFVLHNLRFHAEGFPEDAVATLRVLDAKITGTSFWERFLRFVLNTNWDEDYRIDEGKVIEESAPSAKVVGLARDLAGDSTELLRHLPRLVVAEGYRLYEFGRELALAARTPNLTHRILECQEGALPALKTQFIGGYFSGVRTTDRDTWQQDVLELLHSNRRRAIGVEIVLRSGVSDKVVATLVELMDKKLVAPRAFSMLGQQAAEAGVAAETLESAATALLDQIDVDSQSQAIELLYYYYLRGDASKSLPQALIYRALTATSLFTRNVNTMVAYYWHQLASAFRKQFPELDLKLFEYALENIVGVPSLQAESYPSEIADSIAQDRPKEAWMAIERRLRRRDRARQRIIEWLENGGDVGGHSRGGAIRYFPTTDVLTWIRRAPKSRAPIVATCLPKTLNADNGGELTQKFIEAFAGDKDMADHLIVHFTFGGGWAGPESAHFSDKRDEARIWMSQTSSTDVRAWLTKYIAFLSKGIQDAEIREERRF